MQHCCAATLQRFYELNSLLDIITVAKNIYNHLDYSNPLKANYEKSIKEY